MHEPPNNRQPSRAAPLVARTTSRVTGARLDVEAGDVGAISVGTPDWFAWLESAAKFAFTGPTGSFTARKEARAGGGLYWKAYRTVDGNVKRTYLGRGQELTLDRLNRAAADLAGMLADPARITEPHAPTAVLPAHLLATKLFSPPTRTNLVARQHLFERLQSGLRGKLTLISAPAGFGKTTLLSAWRATPAGGAAPFAWVSLDPTDNDPVRFWSYFIAALDTLVPGAGKAGLALLQSPQPPPIEAILTGVLNAISATAGKPTASVTDHLVLVLDDYHVITTPAISSTFAFLLDHMPPQLHLVILTRADPAFPLARLRASGTVTEMHANDLRFTPDEVAVFLNQVMGLALTTNDLAALEARTEGWIAGLQLVALAMRDHGDRGAFVRTFSGSNRYIVDYLVAEVLAHQPPHIQNFLLHTSILDQMCGSLCAAILDGLDSAITTAEQAINPMLGRLSAIEQPPSQRILEELESANLFVVPLDDERRWYRYHHLFAEVLRQHLQRSVTEATVATLHGRASVWYEQHGQVPGAIEHALRAADDLRARYLIELHSLLMLVNGGTQTVLGWLSRLPEELIRDSPQLCGLHALALMFINDLAAAEARLQDSERCILDSTPAERATMIRGDAAAIRANMAMYRGDIAGCIAYGQQVLRLLPETEVIARTMAALHLTRTSRVTGDVTEEAERAVIGVVAPIRASNNMVGTVGAVTNLARLQVMQGKLCAAAETYRDLVRIAAEPDELRGLHGGLAYYAGMGDLHREWNDLDAAAGYLDQALQLSPGSLVVDAEDVTLCYLAQAYLQHERGDHEGAVATLSAFADLARRRNFASHLRTRGAAVQAQLALYQGDLRAAVAWAEESGLHAREELNFSREAEQLILARVLIAQAGGDMQQSSLDAALDLLERLLMDATAKCRMNSVVEILIVLALGLQSAGRQSDAITTISQALTHAAPQGYIRRFVDEGPYMLVLLQEAWDLGVEAEYVSELLAAFAPTSSASVSDEREANVMLSYAHAPVPMVDREPLSERELEVLRLIIAGKSNAEVAQTLVIAVSTVKTHTNSIFSKLSVSSRTQAIAQAHDLHLI